MLVLVHCLNPIFLRGCVITCLWGRHKGLLEGFLALIKEDSFEVAHLLRTRTRSKPTIKTRTEVCIHPNKALLGRRLLKELEDKELHMCWFADITCNKLGIERI